MYAKRSAIERAGGYRDLRVAQDYDLWLRAAAAGVKLGRVGTPCVAYRLSEAQVSRQLGYAERISGQPEIRESYTALLDYLDPGTAVILNDIPFGDRNRRDVIEGVLRKQVPKLNPALRLYYNNLIARGLLGPLA
jgi:hypothetical protein